MSFRRKNSKEEDSKEEEEEGKEERTSPVKYPLPTKKIAISHSPSDPLITSSRIYVGNKPNPSRHCPPQTPSPGPLSIAKLPHPARAPTRNRHGSEWLCRAQSCAKRVHGLGRAKKRRKGVIGDRCRKRCPVVPQYTSASVVDDL